MKNETTITQLYCEKLENEIKELKEDKRIIFDLIAELYDRIEDGEIEQREIFEKLADIQQYAK